MLDFFFGLFFVIMALGLVSAMNGSGSSTEAVQALQKVFEEVDKHYQQQIEQQKQIMQKLDEINAKLEQK